MRPDCCRLRRLIWGMLDRMDYEMLRRVYMYIKNSRAERRFEMKENLIKLIDEILKNADERTLRVVYAFVSALLKK